jgi:hypothetical protein
VQNSRPHNHYNHIVVAPRPQARICSPAALSATFACPTVAKTPSLKRACAVHPPLPMLSLAVSGSSPARMLYTL